jgi:hypothetical protein
VVLALLLQVARPQREADHSPTSCVEVSNNITRLHGVGLNYTPEKLHFFQITISGLVYISSVL